MFSSFGIIFAIRSPSRTLKPDDARHIAHHASRFHLAEGDDLRDATLAVFLPDVFEHFAAARFAKIHIDIRRRNALGIEEPLEDQSVLQRIDIGNSEDIGDDRTRGRTATRSDRNAALFREMDEVPDDEEITDKTRLLENIDFVVEPLD